MTVRQGGTAVPPTTTDPVLLRDVLAECDPILELADHLPTQESEH